MATEEKRVRKTETIKGLDALPTSPGVYIFKDRTGKILYIGKATSLRDRVRSYLRDDLLITRGPKLEQMIARATEVVHTVTGSVLEALVLEAYLIKKHLPEANSREKDSKSFNYVVITNERWPRVLKKRGRDIALENRDIAEIFESTRRQDTALYKEIFGPFVDGSALIEAMKLVRKIFPYRDEKCTPADELPTGTVPRPCFNRQIGLCPGVCTGDIRRTDYLKTIRNIKLFFEGKTTLLKRTLEKDMKQYAAKREFEKAAAVRGTLFALRHIHDVALISKDIKTAVHEKTFRIEAYDIAHLAGRSTVGVMTVVEQGEVRTSEYRRFKIRGHGGTKGNDDIGNLTEIISRRLNHPEWPLPDLVVVDGGRAQLEAARKAFSHLNVSPSIVSVVKDDTHKPKNILGDAVLIKNHKADILIANAEAHRYAMSYHTFRRGKDFRALM